MRTQHPAIRRRAIGVYYTTACKDEFGRNLEIFDLIGIVYFFFLYATISFVSVAHFNKKIIEVRPTPYYYQYNTLACMWGSVSETEGTKNPKHTCRKGMRASCC